MKYKIEYHLANGQTVIAQYAATKYQDILGKVRDAAIMQASTARKIKGATIFVRGTNFKRTYTPDEIRVAIAQKPAHTPV